MNSQRLGVAVSESSESGDSSDSSSRRDFIDSELTLSWSALTKYVWRIAIGCWATGWNERGLRTIWFSAFVDI